MFRLILFILAACYFIFCEAQTKVALPPARIEFSELSKSSTKLNRKDYKLNEKVRKKEIKRINRILKKNTSLSKDSISSMVRILNTMDSSELKTVRNDLILLKKSQISFNNSEVNIDPSNLKYDTISSVSIIGKKPVDSVSIKSIAEKYQNVEYDNYDSVRLIYRPDSVWIQYKKLHQDSLDVDSEHLKITDSYEDKIKSYFDRVTKNKIAENSRMSELDDLQANSTDVQSHISSLESLNYRKPDIPDERLLEGRVVSELEKKKDQLNPIKTRSDSTHNTRKQRARFKIGGYAQYRPRPQRVELTPSISYLLTEKLLIGVGYTAGIPLAKDTVNSRISGYRFFSQYYFAHSYFFHLESEWSKLTIAEATPIKQRSFYVGIGRSIRFRSISTEVMVLYNFNAPNQLQNKQIAVRFGLNFTK